MSDFGTFKKLLFFFLKYKLCPIRLITFYYRYRWHQRGNVETFFYDYNDFLSNIIINFLHRDNNNVDESDKLIFFVKIIVTNTTRNQVSLIYYSMIRNRLINTINCRIKYNGLVSETI